jgi:hypothetical protein
MPWLRRFGAFWFDFVVGDDWRCAVAVVIALALTGLASAIGVPSWWILPAAVVVVFPFTLWRAARRR